MLIANLQDKMHHSIIKQLATSKDDFTNLTQLAKQCQHIEHVLKNANQNQANHKRFTAQKKSSNWTALALALPNAYMTRLIMPSLLANHDTATPYVILQPPQGQFTSAFALGTALAPAPLVNTSRALAPPLS